MDLRILIGLLLFIAVEARCKVFPGDLRMWELRGSLGSKTNFQAVPKDKYLIGDFFCRIQIAVSNLTKFRI